MSHHRKNDSKLRQSWRQSIMYELYFLPLCKMSPINTNYSVVWGGGRGASEGCLNEGLSAVTTGATGKARRHSLPAHVHRLKTCPEKKQHINVCKQISDIIGAERDKRQADETEAETTGDGTGLRRSRSDLTFPACPHSWGP